MASGGFVHLHVHTEYSLLDGAVRIGQLMAKAKSFGMPAVAMTDHGNLFGAIEFYQAAEKAGIKPIIGCEVYMAPGDLTDRSGGSARDAAFHFTLLAATDQGYANLMKLVSMAHLDGFYYKPRIDKAALARHAQGLIGLSGCLKGEINSQIVAGRLDAAKETAAQYRDILGPENFFLEIHDHGIEQQAACNRAMPGIAKDLGLGLVGANDVHFLERTHHDAHDVLVCIGTQANVADEKRLRYVPELYFKSPQEMRALFSELPEAADNTLAIAERCGITIEFNKLKYPNYDPPEGFTQAAYLRKICEEGVVRRFGSRADSAEVRERMERELDVLEKQGYINYFLIVWDFIKWAKEQGIPVGPGRGSAAGSLVAYVMGITDIDPLQFKLLFERFLNPERVSPPDIDVDFCQNGRAAVIDYVKRKYGERAVAQIITFGTLGAKSALRDVGRVLGLGYGAVDRLAKMIPTGPGNLDITLAGFDTKNKETGQSEHVDGAIDKNPELRAAVDGDDATRQLWDYAVTLEGLTRNTGVHAAGVVIGDRDLSDYVPLTRANDGGIVSQYPMQPLSDLGMLKMDFLGLKTLTVIQEAQGLIRQRVPDFEIDTIPLEDQATFDLLNRGWTVALFQLESSGMAATCRRFDIRNIDDINAVIALYRPGPMSLIPDYIKRKRGEAKVAYDHPLLEKVSADTFGVLIYQEQVMQAAQVLAGYTLGGADLLRRAMGKKDKAKMAKERETFIKGCAAVNGIPAAKANDIFDVLEKFAGYGFNRSHSAAYAWISYRTAYLKANYPVEFMAAVLSNEVNNTDKIGLFVNECRRMGIDVLGPDVNRSALGFRPESDTDRAGIRYGLAAVKNVGEAAMEAAVEERGRAGAFKSLEDFCRRLDPRKINRKVVESLVKAGAFDFTGEDRAALFARIESAIASAVSSQRDKAAGQASLFGGFDETVAPAPSVAEIAPWPEDEKLANEKALLGFYVTGHPLEPFAEILESAEYQKLAFMDEVEERAPVKVGGLFSSVDKKFSKKDGSPFAITVLEDLTGSIGVNIWTEAFEKFGRFVEVGKPVTILGKVDKREETPRIIASEIKPMRPPDRFSPVVLAFDRSSVTERDLVSLAELIRQYPGDRPLELEFRGPGDRRVRLKAGERYRVKMVPALRAHLERFLAP